VRPVQPQVGGGRGTDPNAGRADTPRSGRQGTLRAVLFNWMWHQGMLKGTDERGLVATLEYQAKAVDDQVGRPAVHALEVSREHQLPDLQSAD
jgi:hypothetical protein